MSSLLNTGGVWAELKSSGGRQRAALHVPSLRSFRGRGWAAGGSELYRVIRGHCPSVYLIFIYLLSVHGCGFSKLK